MNYEIAFSVVGIMSFVGWGALALTPLRPAILIKAGRIVSIALAVMYIAILAFSFATEPKMSFATFDKVSTGFGFPGHLLAGWTHFLAFDLLIGVWEAEEAQRIRLPHFVLVVCLSITFLFGPAGFLLFVLLRNFFIQRLSQTS